MPALYHVHGEWQRHKFWKCIKNVTNNLCVDNTLSVLSFPLSKPPLAPPLVRGSLNVTLDGGSRYVHLFSWGAAWSFSSLSWCLGTARWMTRRFTSVIIGCRRRGFTHDSHSLDDSSAGWGMLFYPLTTLHRHCWLCWGDFLGKSGKTYANQKIVSDVLGRVKRQTDVVLRRQKECITDGKSMCV